MKRRKRSAVEGGVKGGTGGQKLKGLREGILEKGPHGQTKEACGLRERDQMKRD